MLKKNAPEKIIALIGAGLLWFFVAYPSEIVQRDFTVPVAYQNVPDQILIGSVIPKEITVTLAGRGANAFDAATPEDLSITIEGSAFKDGVNTVALDNYMVHRPLNLGVINISPQQVNIHTTEYARHIVPVSVTTKGRPPLGVTVDSIHSDPTTIAILIPKDASAPEFIKTEAVVLTDIKDHDRVTAKLVIPPHIYLSPRSPAEVGVEVILKKK